MPRSTLTSQERAQRRRLVLSDSLSLAIVFLATVLLALIAKGFYEAYESHQAALAARWRTRGEAALKENKPLVAIAALRSALALEPAQRGIEIDLAEALANAGRTSEAVSYFNTLAEAEPGSGMINLQLARLAERQGNVEEALEYYQRAIYGDWEGDGYVRRREARMAMIQFLLSRGLYAEARNELLVAAGNAPEGDSGLLLSIAKQMEEAQDPTSALGIYRLEIKRRYLPIEGLEGAGRAAFELGRYREAKQYLEEAVNLTNSHRANGEMSQSSLDLLGKTSRMLLLELSRDLPRTELARRVLTDLEIARQRLTSCAQQQAAQSTTAAVAPPVKPLPGAARLFEDPLKSLASRFGHGAQKKSKPASAVSSTPPGLLANLQARWRQQPATPSIASLQGTPGLIDSDIQLIYDTERITQQVCGAPTGDNALLLRIAETSTAPGQ